ncbi:hypothetical protein ACSBR2_024490 [Camellia fascicularis]
MNLQKLADVCSSIPLLNCALETLFILFSSSDQNSIGANSGESISMSKEEGNEAATANNLAAQKHFRQLQHIRGA